MRLNAFLARRPRPAALPPLWLAASALGSAIVALFGVARWVSHFASDPNAEDYRLQLGAARVGLEHGWSHIYDIELQKAASAGIGPIDSMHVFISPPSVAWVAAPLASLSVSSGYLAWTLINLAALVVAWRLVVTGSPLARATLLAVALAVWPMHYQFWLGQTVVATLALLAVSWWLLERDHVVLAGIVLALSFGFKPQDALLVPLALLVSGRWKAFAAFAVAGAILFAASAATIGTSGIAAWLNDVTLVRADPHTAPMTYSYLFGRGALAAGVEVGLGLAALGFAWHRRERLDLVFALGLAGTTASATYLHEDDIAILVLAAWILLRTRQSVALRVWLLAGVAAAQLIAIGQALPMLIWEPVWIVLLGFEPLMTRPEARQPAVETPGLSRSL
ncbi:MAG TPA: glycosyltransferase family 87 protein [Candidatus Sulfotelmatobacter sp.]|nr:glycosyltransferase family 87 protein [Candidatus Sulfotelmatobacter sp.]